MAKYLVIVESPTKERTISKFLGSEYIVKSSYGHITDLPQRKLGVDIEKDFEPHYVVIPKAKKIIPALRSASQASKLIYLATDFDREGEAIAWHLKEVLKLSDKKTKRITFHEITKEALQKALESPRDIDPDLVNSQQARRVLDRLVGYKLSPLLWRKVKRGLSAGRVQSVAVRLISDREDEIKQFKPQEYWSLLAELVKNKDNTAVFHAGLFSKNGKKFEKMDIKEKKAVDSILESLKDSTYKVLKVEAKEKRRSPFPPFITSTMQQDASRKLHFSAAKTMLIAQNLYEGITLDSDESIGLVTYMRTDSLNVAESARAEAKKFIETAYGKEFLPPKERVYLTKVKGAQEAHEAIRPTSVNRTPESIKKFLTPDQYKLYNLVWGRFLASQMTDAVYNTVSVDISAGEYVFRANGRTLKFKGFLEIYEITEADEDGKEKDETLPPLTAEEVLKLIKLVPEQHFTEPPPRYNEASLIRALEEHGIGRPSTYAPIMKTILDRGYVRLEQRRFYPTGLGQIVNGILEKNFSEIVDLQFTASVEAKLDLVAEGKAPWASVVKEFYVPFLKNLELAETNLQHVKVEPEKTDEICPNCGKPMVLRDYRRGKFLACSGFPACRTTFSVDKDNHKIIKPKPEMTDIKCEKCERPMLKRIGKRGPFLACSGFPKCRNIKKIKDDSVKTQQVKDEKQP